MAAWEYVYDARGKGACCSQIRIQLEGKTIREVKILDGCKGNHTGIERLVVGCPADEIVQRLAGTPCRNQTSCPDQLAKALEAALAAAPK